MQAPQGLPPGSLMADKSCSLASSDNRVDILTKLDHIFAKFWSRLSEQLKTCKHQKPTGNAPRQMSSGSTGEKGTLTLAKARQKQQRKHYTSLQEDLHQGTFKNWVLRD
ncbi:Hypothetical predicted protein [Pelobates cultripes]|uniref:Uncharacterized protein n=1 Tax=Pelobates cultripes TaxID=61616 RepID=A0AAD1SGX5_PELCU|nr:Hypothetical predicted protein [Pelobates cultripes]